MTLQFDEKIISQNDTQNPLHEQNQILTVFSLPSIIPCEYDVIGQNDTQTRLHGFKAKLIIFDLANKKKI